MPSEYFCELDADGLRRDRLERPELHCGTVEFVAPAEYMVRPPQPPVFLFVVEVSYTAVASGMLRCVAATLQHTLARLPGGERTQVPPRPWRARVPSLTLRSVLAFPPLLLTSS